jgi:hypothetical protein
MDNKNPSVIFIAALVVTLELHERKSKVFVTAQKATTAGVYKIFGPIFTAITVSFKKKTSELFNDKEKMKRKNTK